MNNNYSIIVYKPYIYLRFLCFIMGYKVKTTQSLLEDQFTAKYFPELLGMPVVRFCDRCHLKV